MACSWVSGFSSTRGILGHRATRPNRASSAGNRVSPARIAKTTPMAVAGPTPRLEVRAENSKHNRPAMTVVPDASTAGTVPFQAIRVAVQRDGVWCRASRNRAV